MAKQSLHNRKDLTIEEVYGIINNYILEQIDLSSRKSIDEESFDKPAWSEFQAFQLGQRKAYNKLLDFIKPLTKGN